METTSTNLLMWLGIVICITQSGMFSGLNLALIGISRLRLEVEAQAGNPGAQKILELRKDTNFLLTSILWANVAINVLLTLLSNSVMTGLFAFVFSTFVITFGGEILPQAYFSRNAMRMGALLAPIVRFYQVIFYPVAKPSALILDWWLGKEGISYFRERDLHTVIRKHYESDGSEVSELEGIGAINFLQLDDLVVSQEGSLVDRDSIIELPAEDARPVFPEFERRNDDPFLRRISRSGKKWIIIVDPQGSPYMALNANTFLRDALFDNDEFIPREYCHRPIVVEDPTLPLGVILPDLKVSARNESGNIIENDLILLWADDKRVITGTDILGRLLHDIATAMEDLVDAEPLPG